MKILKRTLSMALVIVMAFSLLTLAGAKKVTDYSDASSITYKEAVDTLTGLGILQGFGDTTFGPQQNVTREQAAKITAYLLIGSTAADSLKTTSTSFSDVAADRWSAPYIQFCVTKGIINGMGDGTFAPEASVTGTQFGKMLLTALGYGKLGEYVGSDWSINTLVDAQNLGILNLSADYADAATREQIAQYAFNAYTGDRCYSVALSSDLSAYIDLSKGSLAQQQGVSQSQTAVIGGQSCYQWLNKSGTAVTGNWWPASTDKVLYVSSLGTKLTTQLSNPTSVYYKASADNSVKYYINGADNNGGVAYTASDIDAVCKIGVPVSLIDTDSNGKYNVVSAVVQNVLQLSGDAAVSASGAVTVPGIVSNADSSKVTGYQGLAAGDYVLWYKDLATGVYHITKAEKLQGMLTGGNAVYGTFAGSTHFASGLVAASDEESLATFVSNPQNFNVAATAYVDDTGAIIAISADTSSTVTYGLAVGYQYNGALTNTASVKLIKEDGTVGVYSQAAQADGTVKDLTATLALTSSNTRALVSYYFTSDGKIVLTPASSTESATSGAYAQKSSSITTDAGTYYITSATKVFYFDNGAAYGTSNPGSVTVGYAGTAGVGDNTNVSLIAASSAPSVLNVIVFDSGASVSASTNYAYVPIFTGSSMRVVNGVTLYDYSVYVGGKMTTLTGTTNDLFGASTFTGGLFKYTINTNGYVTSTTQTTADSIYAPTTGDGSVVYIDAGHYFVYNASTAGTTAVLVNDSTKYYLVDNDVNNYPGTITAGALSASTAAVTYKVLSYTTDSNGVATEVYYTSALAF